jgi:hypothetical protein
MAEQRHQGLHVHPGVDQLGGVGVPQLVWGDPQRAAVAAGQTGGIDRDVETAADAAGGDAGAAQGE